ncbi:hypothetical protein L9F63_006425, partial [Diploptera punctata]
QIKSFIYPDIFRFFAFIKFLVIDFLKGVRCFRVPFRGLYRIESKLFFCHLSKIKTNCRSNSKGNDCQ